MNKKKYLTLMKNIVRHLSSKNKSKDESRPVYEYIKSNT